MDCKIRHVARADAAHIEAIVRATQVLDINSCYAYLVLCDYFSSTCLVATVNNTVVGFVTAFVPPEQPNHLFIWQVGVHPEYRRKGLGQRLLHALVNAEACEGIEQIEATISPSNQASRGLFTQFAMSLGAEISYSAGYTAADFGAAGHEDEERVLIKRCP